MTSAFIDVRTVLDMTWLRLPRAPRPTFADRPRVYFLWPVYTRQVLIRQRRRRRLNLFQEHVLRLARAGVTDAARVAALLVPAAYGPGNRPGLAGVPLVRRVQAELQLLRALDAGLRPTEGADEILADGESDQDDVTACFTFQDPWTGELWERFPEFPVAGHDRDPLGASRGRPVWRAGPRIGWATPATRDDRASVGFVRMPFARARGDHPPVRPLRGGLAPAHGTQPG